MVRAPDATGTYPQPPFVQSFFGTTHLQFTSAISSLCVNYLPYTLVRVAGRYIVVIKEWVLRVYVYETDEPALG